MSEGDRQEERAACGSPVFDSAPQRSPGSPRAGETDLRGGEPVERQGAALTSGREVRVCGTERDGTLQHADGLVTASGHRGTGHDHRGGGIERAVCHDQPLQLRHLWLPQTTVDVTPNVVSR